MVDSASADIVFPNADGSGDLSKVSAWAPYNWDDAATNAVRFEGKNQTYTITTNVTFNSVWMHAQKATNVFELAKDQKVTLTSGNLRTCVNDWSNTHLYSLTTVRGGTWDLCGKGILGIYYDYRRNPSTSLVLDNVTITNAGTVRVGYWVSNNHLILTNGASVFCDSIPLYYDTNQKCSFEIHKGCRLLYQNGNAKLVGSGSDNLFLVSGEGASITGLKSAAYAIGGTAHGNLVRIEKGASAKFPGAEFYVGGEDAYSNRIEVLDGATLQVPRIYFPNANTMTCYDNTILVSNATLSVSDIVGISGGNRLEVVDGTLKLKGITLGEKNLSTGCVFRVKGNSTVTFSGAEYDVFGNGGNHLVEFDGVKLSSFGSWYYTPGYHNTIRVKNGATLTLGYSHFGLQGTGNRIEVLDDSTLQLSPDNQKTTMNGKECALVISNATLKTGNSLYLTNKVNSSGSVILGGSHPYLYAPKAITVKNSTTFRYGLPTATNEVLACTNGTIFVRSGGAISCDATTVLDIANVEEFQKVIPKTVELTLLKGTALTLPDDVVAAAAEKLPPRTALVKDTKTLVLKIRPLPQGLTLIVR